MLGSNLLDGISCNVKASQTAPKPEYISDYVGSQCRILNDFGLKFGT